MKKTFFKGHLTPVTPGLALLALLGGFLSPERTGAQEEIRLSGQEVAVYNLAGRVDIAAGSGSDVVVQVTRGGNDGRELTLDVIRVDGKEALVIRYPAGRVVYPEMGRGSRTRVRIRDDGTFGGGVGRGGDQVDIRGSGPGVEAWADLRISVPAGKDMGVFLAVGETEAIGVEGDLLIDTGSGAVSARKLTGNLEVDTGSGRVVVEEVRGNLTVDTGSGEVEVSEIQGDQVTVDTGSGGVSARDVTASRIEVDTGSGKVVLARVSAPAVYVDTGSGGVEVELLQDVEDLVVDTGSGSVIIRLPEGIGAEIEADTGSGGIEVGIPLEIRKVERNYIRGVLGDGRGRISIDTGSGSIRLLGG